jgi:hypothetical protein
MIYSQLSHRRFWSFGIALVFSAVVAGCASGPPLLLGQPIKKEVAVVVHVSAEAAHGDQFGGIGSIVETVTDGLTKRGVANQVYAADDDHPGTPRIEILVTHWSEANADLREAGRAVAPLTSIVGAGLQAASAGKYEVIVNIYREGDVQPTCVMRHSGSVSSDDPDSDASTGEHLGSLILLDSLRPKADCTSPKGGGHSGR